MVPLLLLCYEGAFFYERYYFCPVACCLMMSEADNNSETLSEKKEFSNAQPIKFFLAPYALTGGFYFFYWFYKNLTNFKDPKVLNQNS